MASYTGLRLSEGLALLVRDLRIDEGFVYLPHSKNEEPRAVHLPPFVVSALMSHPRGLNRDGGIFRFTKGQRLYQLLARATEPAGVPWFTFHAACHTYATWMRRYSGLDERGLVGTGRWKDRKSVARYAYVVTTEEARKADALPTPTLEVIDAIKA
jgi:integrase